jgi:hypothetical protein
MNVLIACEESGIVRDEFIKRGHNAFSCDLMPTAKDGPHFQMDVRQLITPEACRFYKWNLMVAHPVCRYLANSGVRWLHTQEGRWENMRKGADFFRMFLEADIPKIAVENPIIHKYARDLIGRPCDQVVQPWMFGHTENKATCWWLKGLDPLVPTHDVRELMTGMRKKDTDKVHYMSPGPDREKLRSRTLIGHAEAIAEQWGSTN